MQMEEIQVYLKTRDFNLGALFVYTVFFILAAKERTGSAFCYLTVNPEKLHWFQWQLFLNYPRLADSRVWLTVTP